MEYVDWFVQTCTSFLSQFGPIAGILLILLESIIPALPLSVFITLNMVSYGNILGFFLSYLTTILGCTLSFFLFRSTLRDKLYHFMQKRNHEEIERWMKNISHISFSSLAIILAIPFTPAFFVNIAAGLSKMHYRKYFFALVIGKMIMVYFWGYIGTTLLESLTDVAVFLKIILLLLLTYGISKFLEKKLQIK